MEEQNPETEYKVTERELTARPLVDLLELPITAFSDLLRGESLPSLEILEALDNILRHHVVQMVKRKMDVRSWEEDIRAMRRLVPHDRRAELDRSERPWAARWATLADVLATAPPKFEGPEDLPFHGDRILKEVKNCPGISQEDLLTKVNLRPQNLSRNLGQMEARGYIKREIKGNEKFVYLTDRGRATVEE